MNSMSGWVAASRRIKRNSVLLKRATRSCSGTAGKGYGQHQGVRRHSNELTLTHRQGTDEERQPRAYVWTRRA